MEFSDEQEVKADLIIIILQMLATAGLVGAAEVQSAKRDIRRASEIAAGVAATAFVLSLLPYLTSAEMTGQLFAEKLSIYFYALIIGEVIALITVGIAKTIQRAVQGR